MKTSILVAVWVYTLLAVLAEVYVAYAVTDLLYSASAIIAFAISQAAAVVAFYMNLREEPGSLILMVIIPLMFISGLLITVVASQGSASSTRKRSTPRSGSSQACSRSGSWCSAASRWASGSPSSPPSTAARALSPGGP